MADESGREFSNSEKRALLWRTVESDFVENGVKAFELAKKYKLSRSAVYKKIKAGAWKEKRKDFLDADSPENDVSVADRRDRLIEWFRSEVESVHIRILKLIQRQDEQLALPVGHADYLKDTPELVNNAMAMLSRQDELRRKAFGEEIEVIQHDITYLVEVEEQKPRVRILEDGEKPQEPEIIEIPRSEVEELGLIVEPRRMNAPTNGEPDDET